MVHSSRFLAAVLFALLWFPSAGFAQFFVNTPADLPDPDLADPTCGDPTTHLCSLRAAIMQANASAPACMTISLSDGLYAVGSDLAVTGCAIVTGVGAGPDCHIGGCRASATWTIIEAVPREWPLRSRIFDVRPSGELHLHDLILRGGDARRPDVWRTPPDSGHLGGAIFNMGHLGMSNVLFTENRAEIGGALFNWAFADLIEVEMTRNESTWNGRDGCGGALVNTGRITILRSFFNLNRSQGDGGAICHGLDGFFSTRDPEPPYFNMFDSTVAFNRAARNGGGLVTHRNTRVNQVTIRGNTAEHGRGGGIDSHTGLNLLESTVTGNHALGGRRRVTGFPPSFQECFVCGLGGGVFSEADLLVDGTTIENNDVDRDGGGLYARTSAVVRRSALVRNMAANNGGGIFFQGHTSGHGLLLVHSTVSGNGVRWGGGGGVYVAADSVAESFFATIAFNAALFGAGGLQGEIGSFLYSTSTIFARNLFSNCGGMIGLSMGYTLEDGTGCTRGVARGDQRGVDPLLRPLALDGARTPTHALGRGSPAIDALPPGALVGAPPLGVMRGCPAGPDSAFDDQRGVERPVGFGCDIGAYEVRLMPSAPPAVRVPAVALDGAMMALTSTAGDMKEMMTKSQNQAGAALSAKLADETVGLHQTFDNGVESQDLIAAVKSSLASLDPIEQTLEMLDGCCRDAESTILFVELRSKLDALRADLMALLERLTKFQPAP